MPDSTDLGETAVLDLDQISEVSLPARAQAASEYGDDYQKSVDDLKLKHAIDLHEEQVEDLRQDRTQRKEYAHKLFVLICAWLGSLIFMLLLQGIGVTDLSDGVLITMITGTTVNVLGLFIVVLHHLYPKR